jgi:uncharacterized protein YndB with AHSA1/START domain
MSLKKEANGRRSVQIEVDVAGTPEEVWQAIATGPGISSWFVPAVFEEKDGKPVVQKLMFGPGIEVAASVTAWNPPHSFAKEMSGWMPDAPSIADEWTVEARDGGRCIVRIVHSHFASTDEWDNQLEGTAAAWPGFLRTLQLYLAHFRGQRSHLMQVSAVVHQSDEEAWDGLTASLGLTNVTVGQRWTSPEGAPAISGVVEYVTRTPGDALIRIDTPAPGIVAVGASTFPDGPTTVAMNFYLYGDQAASVAAHNAPVWDAWFQEKFPAPADLSPTS